MPESSLTGGGGWGVLVMSPGRDDLCGEMPPLGDSAFFRA